MSSTHRRGAAPRTVAALGLLAALLVAAGCGGDAPKPPGPAPRPERRLRIFHAAGLTALLESVRADCRKELGIVLETEGSGSQMACRKVTEMKRACDLVMLADSFLVGELLGGTCSWRLDFATDEVVLGVGRRAPRTAEAEKDWPAVLLSEGVRVGRVDENLGPIGYRTLMVWKLQELRGTEGLYDKLLGRCERVVDDVGRLTPLLRVGDLDYAFVYRSTCVAHDVRYIRLGDAVSLGSPDEDYSKASVTFQKLRDGVRQPVTVKGGPVCWTLSVPRGAERSAAAAEFANWLLKRRAEDLEKSGLRPIRPARYYGPDADAAAFKEVARQAGKQP